MWWARTAALLLGLMFARVRDVWAFQSEGVDSTDMTMAMMVGGVVLVATQVFFVVAAIVWYVKTERRRNVARVVRPE